MIKQFTRNTKKRRGFFYVLNLFALCAFLCAGCAAPVQKQASEPVTIKIVHTNDIHGRSAYQEESVVGFEKLAALIAQEQPALVLDVGDTFHGQAFATLEQGIGMAELLKSVKYDAMTPGNHDWHYGKDRLKELQTLSEVPILAGNVIEADSAFFANDGTLIKTVDGVKIGILGVFDPVLKNSTAPRNIEGLSFSDDAQKATELAGQLREQGCDIVVALSHQLDCEEFVSRTQNIDLLLAGHEHAVFDESYPDADIAFENAGGIRIGKLLPAGEITVGDIVDTAPFGNYIVTKEISGEAVRSIIERSIEIGLQNKKAYDEWKKTGSDQVIWPEDDGNYLQFGGMTILYDTAKPLGERVVSVQVGDAPLNPEQLYIVAANNYTSLGKTYPELADVPELNQYAACDEALIRCIGQGQEWVDAAANKACLEEVTTDSATPAQKAA